MITANDIYLRPVSMRDFRIIHEWENNPEFWPVTGTPGPFSEEDIEEFIRTSGNLFTHNQMRWMICSKRDDQPVGALDVFEYNNSEKSAGLGILIADEQNRRRGFAHQAISSFCNFAFETLRLNSLHCIVYLDNTSSIKLFEKNHFEAKGISFFKNKKTIRYQLDSTVK
jgi:diamine N-acetyltransferase